jgi:hypothetical protein
VRRSELLQFQLEDHFQTPSSLKGARRVTLRATPAAPVSVPAFYDNFSMPNVHITTGRYGHLREPLASLIPGGYNISVAHEEDSALSRKIRHLLND